MAAALTSAGSAMRICMSMATSTFRRSATAFVVQASVSFALALLILIGGPSWLQWAAAALAGGALGAFVLSRTVGLFGFSETGWQPSPHAAISVAAEVLAVGLWAVSVIGHRRAPAPQT